VRDGKGGKERVTMLPQSLIEPLRLQLAQVKALHDADLAAGIAEPVMPDTLRHSFANAGTR
jgi:integrase